MKKIFLLSAASVFLLASCNNAKKDEAGGMSERAKKNLDAAHVVNKAFETGDVSGLDAVIAENFVDHTPQGDWGRDSVKSMVAAMRKASPDMKMTTNQEFANDDYTFGWYRWTGTGDGMMMPKGPYDMQAIEIVKYNADSKAIEHWEYMNPKDVMEMMKAMGGAGAADKGGNMMDSTMKK